VLYWRRSETLEVVNEVDCTIKVYDWIATVRRYRADFRNFYATDLLRIDNWLKVIIIQQTRYGRRIAH